MKEPFCMAANYAKIRDGGKGAGLHYRAFEGFSRVVALNLRQLRREDFQIATRIREVGLAPKLLKGANFSQQIASLLALFFAQFPTRVKPNPRLIHDISPQTWNPRLLP